jgi:hypothetical protein
MFWPTVSRPISLGVGHPFGTHDQILLFPFHFSGKLLCSSSMGRPLWREDGSVSCSTICQWSKSRRTHNHTLLSRQRLLGSLSVASYDSQGLRWKCSNPPPHGEASDTDHLLSNLYSWGGGGATELLYQSRMTEESWAVGAMRIGRGTRSAWGKPRPPRWERL